MEQTFTQSQPVINYGTRSRKSVMSYLNPRIIVFVLAVGAIIGVPLYTFLSHEMSQGVSTRADGYLEVDLKTISTFPFEQNLGTIDDVPARFRELSGKKVALVGEMYVTEASGARVDHFDLVYSITKCCFTGEPQIQHFIKSKSDRPMPFFNQPVRVKGTLTVDVKREAGKVTGIYHLAVDSIEPA